VAAIEMAGIPRSKRMTIDYEWDVEEVDRESEDIIDHWYCQSFNQAVNQAKKSNQDMRWDVVLVCRVEGNRGENGCLDVSYAYLREDGTLPEFFLDASNRPVRKVPKKFHAEVAKLGK
jgi:hypothetical protein